MVSLVLSHLDYANSFTRKLPKKQVSTKMQLVQNIVARITLGRRKYDSATRCLQKIALAANSTENRIQDHQPTSQVHTW